MFGEKALELIKELSRSKGGNITNYNEEIVRQVLEEMRALFNQNQADVEVAMKDSEQYLYPAIQIRHTALERNKRCILSYLYNRLQLARQMRWDFGSILPADIKFCLAEQEVVWFSKYNKMLATYMRSIGGIDLTQDSRPPKTLYIEVRCLTDQGEFETNDGAVISLKKNSQHYLLRSECEHLIRQGILEHVVH